MRLPFPATRLVLGAAFLALSSGCTIGGGDTPPDPGPAYETGENQVQIHGYAWDPEVLFWSVATCVDSCSVDPVDVNGYIHFERSLLPGASVTIIKESDGTVLRGSVVDQAALHGVLGKVRDLGLPLIAVNRRRDQCR